MKRTMLSLALGVLALFAAGGRADEPVCAQGPTCVQEPSCNHCHKHGRECLSRLREWLCYRSPECSVKCACHDCAPCCRPPLYAFFLHRCGCAVPDDGSGYAITYSYTKLLEECGCNSSCHGCQAPCHGCASCK